MPHAPVFPRRTLALIASGVALGAMALVGATHAPPADAASDHRLLPPASACGGLGDDHTLRAGAQERIMRCLVNKVRVKAGRGEVTSHRSLARGARSKNAAMMQHQQFSHTPSGRPFGSLLRAAGYNGRSMGENIAWGMSEMGSPRAILDGWLKSPGHRSNLLRRDWQHQGLALRDGVRFAGYSGVALWTSEFGRMS